MTRTILVLRRDTAIIRVKPNKGMGLDLQAGRHVFKKISCFTAKPLRVPEHDPTAYAEEAVKVLHEAVEEVHVKLGAILVDRVLIPLHLGADLSGTVGEVDMDEIEARAFVGGCPIEEAGMHDVG